MKKERKAKQAAWYAALSLLVVCFIFWNSLQNAEASNAQSDGLLVWLKPLLAPLFGGSEELMYVFVRKAAHFVEFAALGLCLGGLTDGLHRRFWRGSLVFFPLFVVLSVAVTDEFIQSFSDRTSAVKDVILDFSGGVFGLAAACIIFAALYARKKREV